MPTDPDIWTSPNWTDLLARVEALESTSVPADVEARIAALEAAWDTDEAMLDLNERLAARLNAAGSQAERTGIIQNVLAALV